MQKTLLLIFGLFTCGICLSQILTGVVVDENEAPLPFVNIYINGTSKGTTSNAEGAFKLALGADKQEVVFQFIGYQRHLEVFQLSADQTVTVTLYPHVINISEVLINDEADPAEAIIRKAIEKRKFHLNQVQSYQCETYVKGLMQITDIPDKIFGIKTGIEANEDKNEIVYLSESESILYFEKPDKIKETVISSKVSGNDQGFSWNSASDFYFDFYENKLSVDQISERVFISPIASNAFLFYRYEFLGTFEDDGTLVNKIKVIPRRRSDPVFTGVMNIVENRWNIHSLELFITRENQINFLDTLKVEQFFVPVKDVYVPISQKFDFKYSFLKVKGDGYYIGVFKNYDVNLVYDKKFFSNEILSIQEGANEKEQEYWEDVRPIPLTKVEAIDYRVKDSIAIIKESPEYKDSMDREFNKFSPLSLLSGYAYNNSKKNTSVTTNSLLNLIQFNTVEGLNMHLTADFRKKFKDNRRYRISPHLRYGSANKHLNGYLDMGYLLNQKKLETIWFKGGTYVYQFNNLEPISELVNTAYSLFAEKNYLKLYEKYFASLKYRREVFNGVVAQSELEWSKRIALRNRSLYSFKKNEDTQYTSNDPIVGDDDHQIMQNHRALNWSLDLSLRFGEKFISRPDAKIRLGTKYPIVRLSYVKSFEISGISDLNYDFLELKLSDEIPLALFGSTFYQLSAGGFLNNRKLMLPDFKHFSGNQTFFGRNYRGGFQMLDFYTYSTSKWFTQAHVEHHFNGFLFNKLPFIRRLKLQAVVAAHYLYNPDLKSYAEFNVGIENILRIMRVDVVTSMRRGQSPNIGVRLGVDFGAFN